MDKVVIGLVGKQGSGKNTFIEYLKRELPQRNIDHIKSGSGGVLDAFLTIVGLPILRENQQKIARGLREHFGDDFISEAIAAKIRKSTAEIVIFDAVRWRCDERVVRKFNKNILVFIDANNKTRFQRLKDRSRGNEGNLTGEQFEAAELDLTEIEIDDIGSRADFMIANDDSPDSLILDVRFFCEKFSFSNGNSYR